MSSNINLSNENCLPMYWCGLYKWVHRVSSRSSCAFSKHLTGEDCAGLASRLHPVPANWWCHGRLGDPLKGIRRWSFLTQTLKGFAIFF